MTALAALAPMMRCALVPAETDRDHDPVIGLAQVRAKLPGGQPMRLRKAVLKALAD